MEIVNKLIARVLPGVRLTFANPLRCSNELMSDDLPTLERPTKAISGASPVGNSSGLTQLLINSALRIFTVEPIAWGKKQKGTAIALHPFVHCLSHCSFHTQPRMRKSTRRKSTRQRRGRLTLILLLCTGLSIAALLFIWLITMPDISALQKANPSTTALIESREAQARTKGRAIGRHWIWVPLSRVSPHLRRAVVVAEDASFFAHEGFDWEGIKDAALYNLEKGEFKRGGSTITQQLAKNLYLSSERSILRKLREALITRSLEQHLSKERILEIYINVAEWGNGVYGAEAAARHHFKKSARAVTEEEAAWLAAILPSPRRYDPLRKTRALTRRYERIIRRMDQAVRQDIRTQ